MTDERIGRGIADYALERIEAEAQRVVARLRNGAGRVEGCSAHSDLADGVRLSLELLLVVLRSSRREQSLHRWSAIGAAVGAIAAAIVAAVRALG